MKWASDIRRIERYWIGAACGPDGLFAVAPSLRSKAEAAAILSSRALSGRTPVQADSPTIEAVFEQLEEYFNARRRSFDIELDMSAGTDFQQAAWRACLRIGYGRRRSYGWIAEQIDRPKASRAVGQALGANPIPIVIPCHRVLRSDGALGGFGGGLPMKRDLLRRERG